MLPLTTSAVDPVSRYSKVDPASDDPSRKKVPFPPERVEPPQALPEGNTASGEGAGSLIDYRG